MTLASSGPFTPRGAQYLAASCVVLALGAAAVVVVATTTPIRTGSDALADGRPRHAPPMPRVSVDVQMLMAEASGRQLIVSAQGLAAVKDSGAAGKLLEQLKLQGVVQIGGEMMAYVLVRGDAGGGANLPASGGAGVLGAAGRGRGTRFQTVRRGDRLLAFTVESIRTGQVMLSLDGVIVELRN